jgi:hypothetical protein
MPIDRIEDAIYLFDQEYALYFCHILSHVQMRRSKLIIVEEIIESSVTLHYLYLFPFWLKGLIN